MKIVSDITDYESSSSTSQYSVVGKYAHLRVDSANAELDANFEVTFGTGMDIPDVARGKTYRLIECRRTDRGTSAILELVEEQPEETEPEA